jgi:hypothetical protein
MSGEDSGVQRLLAWIYTGPIGHLYGTAADIVVLWVRWGAGKAGIDRRRPSS